jgi:trk system potassium uptake protein TrkH
MPNFEMTSVDHYGCDPLDDPTRLGPALHLWRAQVDGWIVMAAVAILVPLNLW